MALQRTAKSPRKRGNDVGRSVDAGPYGSLDKPRLEFWLACAAAVHLATLLLIGAAHPTISPAQSATDTTQELAELDFIIEPEVSLAPSPTEPEASAPPPVAVVARATKAATPEPAGVEEKPEAQASAADRDKQSAQRDVGEADAVVAKPADESGSRSAAAQADAGAAPTTGGLAEALQSAGTKRHGDAGQRRSDRGGLGREYGKGPPDVATLWAPHPDGPIRVEVFDNTGDILVQVTGKIGPTLSQAMAGQGPEVTMPRIKLPLPTNAGAPVASGHARRFERKHSQLVLSSRRLKEMPPGLIRHRGSFFIEEEGEYRFRIVSHNPALLRIDGSDVLAHRVKVRGQGQELEITLRPNAPWAKSATITLTKGSHSFELLYWHLPWPHKSGAGYVYEFGLELFVKPPGKQEQPWTPLPG